MDEISKRLSDFIYHLSWRLCPLLSRYVWWWGWLFILHTLAGVSTLPR